MGKKGRLKAAESSKSTLDGFSVFRFKNSKEHTPTQPAKGPLTRHDTNTRAILKPETEMHFFSLLRVFGIQRGTWDQN